MTQTVIQELIQEMEELREDNIYPESFKAIDECIHLCYSKLEIEKELIIKAHFDGQCDETEGYPIEIAEQYYNETFKSE